VHTQARTHQTSLPFLSRPKLCSEAFSTGCSCVRLHICNHFHLPVICAAGRELARSVKQASRGASVNLRCEGSPAGPQSFYKTEFCERHDKAAKELGLEANPEAYAMVSSWPSAAAPVTGCCLMPITTCTSLLVSSGPQPEVPSNHNQLGGPIGAVPDHADRHVDPPTCMSYSMASSITTCY